MRVLALDTNGRDVDVTENDPTTPDPVRLAWLDYLRARRAERKVMKALHEATNAAWDRYLDARERAGTL